MNAATTVLALSALAHEARLAVFKLLVQAGPQGLAAGIIATRLEMAPPALSFHLKELTHAGLLVQRPEGRKIHYSANFISMNELDRLPDGKLLPGRCLRTHCHRRRLLLTPHPIAPFLHPLS